MQARFRPFTAAGIIRETIAPMSIYSQVSEIIQMHKTGGHALQFLQHPRWEELEFHLGDVLASAPPMFLFIAAPDEEFERAPMYWLRCQLGLFYQVMRFPARSRAGRAPPHHHLPP